MKSKKTGVSTGRIIDTRKVKPIKARCDKCSHFQKKGRITYCKYFDQFSPNRERCARFFPVDRL